MADWNRVNQRLSAVEQLLLQPTPAAIGQADALLREVADLIAEPGPGANNSEALQGPTLSTINDFRIRCTRVAKLLEGARRAQWIHLRLITSVTQTYTASAEAKTWPPQHGSVNIRM